MADRRPFAALPLLLAGCDAPTMVGNGTRVPESTFSLIAERSDQACFADDVQNALQRELAADPGATPAATGYRPSLRFRVDRIALKRAGERLVDCAADVTISSPDYRLVSATVVPIVYRARPGVTQPDRIVVKIVAGDIRPTAAALLEQVADAATGRNRPTPTPAPRLADRDGPPAELPDVAPPRPDPPDPTPQTSTVTLRSFAPSYDCEKVTSPVALMICADADLSRLDRRLADAYRAQLDGAGDEDRRALKSDEQAWIAERGRCATRACIADAYNARLSELEE